MGGMIEPSPLSGPVLVVDENVKSPVPVEPMATATRSSFVYPLGETAIPEIEPVVPRLSCCEYAVPPVLAPEEIGYAESIPAEEAASSHLPAGSTASAPIDELRVSKDVPFVSAPVLEMVNGVMPFTPCHKEIAAV